MIWIILGVVLVGFGIAGVLMGVEEMKKQDFDDEFAPWENEDRIL